MESFFAGTDSFEVIPGFCKAQGTVRPTTDFAGIVVILTIIFPVTHLADVESSSICKSEISATRTLVFDAFDFGFINIYKHGLSCSSLDANLVHHYFAEGCIDTGLVTFTVTLCPGNDVAIQAKGDLLLERFEEALQTYSLDSKCSGLFGNIRVVDLAVGHRYQLFNEVEVVLRQWLIPGSIYRFGDSGSGRPYLLCGPR